MDIDQPERPSPRSTAYGSPSYSPPELEQCTDQREQVKTTHHEAEEDEDDDDDEERKACRKAKGKMRSSSPEEDDDSDDEEQRAARRKAKGKMKASSPSESDDADDEEEKAARRKAKGKGRAYPPTDENYNDDYDDENRPPGPPFAVSLNPLTSHPTPAAAAQEDTSMMDTSDYKANYGYGDERHFGDADAAMNETLSPPSSPYSEDDENNTNNNNENDTFTPSTSRNRLSERRGHAGLAPLDAQSFPAMMQGDGGRGRGRGRGRGQGQGWGLAWQETVTETVERGGWRVYEDPPPSPSMQFVSEEEEEEEVEVVMEDEDMGWEVYDASLWEMAAERAQEQEAGKVTLKVPVPMPSSSPSSSVTRGGGEASGSSSTKPTSSSATTVNYEPLAMHNSGSSGGDEYVRAVRSYKAILTGNFLSYEKDEVMKVIYRDIDGRYFTLLPLKDRATTGRAHTRNFVPTDAPAEAGSVPGEGKSGGVRGERKGG